MEAARERVSAVSACGTNIGLGGQQTDAGNRAENMEATPKVLQWFVTVSACWSVCVSRRKVSKAEWIILGRFQ